MLALGIDIGGTTIKAALMEGGAEVWRGRSARYARPTREAIAATLKALLAESRGHATGARAVGLCVPGMLAADGGSVAASVNVPGLIGARFEELLRIAGVDAGGLEVPVRVSTDARAAATDASRTLGLKGRVLALSIGTGVGACVLDDGVPLIVSGQGPGHFGQMDVSLDRAGAPIGADGGRGSLEAYIGVPALRGRYGDDVEAAVAALTADAVPCRALVRAIRIAHAIYRPDHVLLLGGVGVRLGHVAGALRDETGRELTSVAKSGWTLRCGESDYHAARGAALIATGA